MRAAVITHGYSPPEMKTEYQNNLNTRDLIAIGVFAAISLAIFFVVGGIAAFTMVKTIVGRIHPETGLPVVPERFGWTAVFAEEIVSLARADERIVAITAAMQQPVGLQPLADAMPERVIDVGIAEQHALTAAAGMAYAGLHPVVALYATFLNRAFDQVLMDVGLHGAGVTIVLD